MEELQEFCQAGMPITLSSSWVEFSSAKQLLASHGYIQATEEAKGSVFVKQDTPQCVQQQQIPLATPAAWKEHSICFTKIPQPIYAHSVAALAADAEWKACPCFQLDTAKLPPHNQVRIQAQIPKLSLSKQQTVGMKLLIQPFAKIDEAQLYIKLRIASLVVGVPKAEFLTEDFSLGYYPDFIRVLIEPELSSDLVAIPIYVEVGSQEPMPRAPSAIVKESSDTSIDMKVGFGPATITLQHSRGQEWESSREKHRLIAVEADGNAAGFEWSILRWDDGDKYEAESPHSGLGFILAKEVPKLPFAGTSTAARLDSFPDAIWHLKRDLKDKPLSFGLCLQVQMQLLWFLGSTKFFRSTGSTATAFQFKNHFSFELPRSVQDS